MSGKLAHSLLWERGEMGLNSFTGQSSTQASQIHQNFPHRSHRQPGLQHQPSKKDHFRKCLLLNRHACSMTLYMFHRSDIYKKHENICSDMPARLPFENAQINLFGFKFGNIRYAHCAYLFLPAVLISS